jgi:inorganic pyrophosphatase/exopolyphosphatase
MICGLIGGRAKADIGHLNTTQLLIKDYKQWDRLGISSVTGLSLASELIKRAGFLEAIEEYVEERELGLFCLMTGCSQEGCFERELLLVGNDAKRVVELIRGELELEDVAGSNILMFNQRNLSARYVFCLVNASSRKQVYPLVIQALSKL